MSRTKRDSVYCHVSGKSSHLRSWNKRIFGGALCLKNYFNDSAIYCSWLIIPLFSTVIITVMNKNRFSQNLVAWCSFSSVFLGLGSLSIWSSRCSSSRPSPPFLFSLQILALPGFTTASRGFLRKTTKRMGARLATCHQRRSTYRTPLPEPPISTGTRALKQHLGNSVSCV